VERLNVELIKKGAVAVLPLLKLLAARTKTDIDDQLVSFLEVILVADGAQLQQILDAAPAPLASHATPPCKS
jgi:hypothetical protein